jgi:hypothetical protein
MFESMQTAPTATSVSSIEYNVFSPIKSEICSPKVPPNGCDCGTSYAFLMMKSGSALQCIQLWSKIDRFTSTVIMMNKDSLTLDILPSKSISHDINSLNSSWSVLESQVQDFSNSSDKTFQLVLTDGENGIKLISNDVSRPLPSVNDTFLPLCRGFKAGNGQIIAFPSNEPDSFKSDAVIYSSMSKEEADNKLDEIDEKIKESSELLEGSKDLADGLKDIDSKTFMKVAQSAGKLSKALAIAGPAMAVVSAIFSFIVPEEDVAQKVIDAMNQRFDDLNKKLDDITKVLLEAIADIKKTIADVVLDESMDVLVAVDAAYKDYMLASISSNATASLKSYYANNYR